MPRYMEFRATVRHITPPIWRRFLLEPDATFQDLHHAIQDAGGWEYEHLFEFRGGGRRGQAIATCDFGDPWDVAVPTADELRLSSHFLKAGAKCLYLYDFGDSWEVEVQLKRIVERPETFHRRLLDGKRAFPPEDCGGTYG